MFFLEFSLRFILFVLLDFDLVLVQFALTRDVRPRGPASRSGFEGRNLCIKGLGLEGPGLGSRPRPRPQTLWPR